MRKNAIKKVLFTLASLATLPARADDGKINDLRLMEELPTEQRVVIHKQVVDYLALHPEIAPDARVIAVDGKGTVYVLDEKLAHLASVGAPSCISFGE